MHGMFILFHSTNSETSFDCPMFIRQKARLRSCYEDSLTSHPSNPAPPSSRSPAALAGRYHNAAYGEIELSFAPASIAFYEEFRPSDSCKELIDSAPVILPGVIDGTAEEQAQTFLVHLDGLWDSHARLKHHDGNIFNITLFRSMVRLLSSLLSFRFLPVMLYVA
jgi:hypothetical protein